MENETAVETYLKPTYFIDSDNPRIKTYADEICRGLSSQTDKAVALYYGVRDDIRYDPYSMEDSPEALKASSVLLKKIGFCVPKAVLLTAVLRSQNIPARPGFANVKNHIATQRLLSMMEVDLFVYHGYVEIYLNQKWVKATPAFNLSLCTNFNVKPLEFDGRHDSLFHEFDTKGNRHMEYIKDHGTFADLPFDLIFAEFRRCYPKILALNEKNGHQAFSHEAREENFG